MAKDDRFLMAALGFSATSTIALAAVLLAFALTGGINLLGDDERPLATVSTQGVSVALYRVGLAQAVCLDQGGVQYLYSAGPEESLVYVIIEVEAPRQSIAAITGVKLETATGALEPIKPVVSHAASCNAPVNLEDNVKPYTGGTLDLSGAERVLTVFKINREAPKSGIIMVDIKVDNKIYVAEIVVERCRVTEARISVGKQN